MTLYAFAADRTGCGWYRVGWPLGMLRDRRGLDITVVMPGDETPLLADVHRDEKTGGLTVKGVEVPSDCTSVLMQRPTSALLAQCIPLLQKRGVRVIVELDDDLHALTPRHASYAALHLPESSESVHSLSSLKIAFDLADLCVLSTPALGRTYLPDVDENELHKGSGIRSSGARWAVLRNRLRSDWASCLKGGPGGGRTDPPHTEPRVGPITFPAGPDDFVDQLKAAVTRPVVDHPRIGWGGVITTHPDDLQILSRALPRTPVKEFTIVGPKPEERWGGLPRAARLTGNVPVHFTGSVPFVDWFQALQDNLDIGLAPLETNRFNQSKSWLKPLEYAACGIPCLTSDHAEYTALGVGLSVPDDHRAWRTAINALLASPTHCDELREEGFLIAGANTYDAHSDEWYDVFAPFC